MTILPESAESIFSNTQTQLLLTGLTVAIISLFSSRMLDVTVVELYASNNPFDLKTRPGNRAFEDTLNPLKTVWDGTAQM